MDQTKQSAAEALHKGRQKVAGESVTDRAKDTLHQGEAKVGVGEESYTDRAKQMMEQGKEKMGLGGEGPSIAERAKGKMNELMGKGEERLHSQQGQGPLGEAGDQSLFEKAQDTAGKAFQKVTNVFQGRSSE
jgi:hypothetical protein